MALYAFDGTWQKNLPQLEQDTNVVWFLNAYKAAAGNTFYEPGVGTRKGWIGKLIGGMTGAGGGPRVKEALAAVRKNFKAGDRVIDVVGFSRGAAMALHFANSLPQGAKVRFLGLFDTVPSFGIPGNEIDLGWKLGLPPAAERCFHAMALDERRFMFPLHRLGSDPRLLEMWFHGVHSDIGGGNKNTALSSIALDWMFGCATLCGVKLDPAIIAQNVPRMNPEAAISTLHLDSRLRNRPVLPGDCVHPTVQSAVRQR